jgi:hypothetical protein
LTFIQAGKLLGPQGEELITAGGKWEIDLFEQVELHDRRFRLKLPKARVEISLNPLPDAAFLDTMARSLAQMVRAGGQ